MQDIADNRKNASVPDTENVQRKVGFILETGRAWLGGVHYVNNLIAAVKAADQDKNTELILILDGADCAGDFQSLAQSVSAVVPAPKQSQMFNFCQQQIMRIQNVVGKPMELEPPMGPFLRHHGIDCVFAIGEYGSGFKVPLISWIFDCQHKDLPEMFSAQEISYRDTLFVRMVNHADKIAVTSEHTAKAVLRHYPRALGKIEVLPFSAQLPKGIYERSAQDVIETYKLPERFVYLPNQFWKHKNHECVIRAVKIAVKYDKNVTVVMSGPLFDFRQPDYWSEILGSISRNGLRDNCIILGLVPYDDLFLLMRQSLCLLQPSLYEGLSMTVEECKSLGKRMILSDIPVLRERNAPICEYFDPGNPEQLAELLVGAFKDYKPGPDFELEKLARASLPKRTIEFGRSFLKVVREVSS